MITVGMIAEFNPFHKGHARIAEKIRAVFAERHPGEALTLVAVMSGNFVQRGDLAILPKGYRAEAALRCGFDLVLELPYPYSSAFAEKFAEAGVWLLDNLGLDYIAFGSETGEIGYLERTATRLVDPLFEKTLAALVAAEKGTPYAVLRDRAYESLYGEIPSAKPNDILGVAYLAAMRELDTNLRTVVIKREGRESATASRRAYLAKAWDELEYLAPNNSLKILKNCRAVTLKPLEKAILAFFRLTHPEALDSAADMPVGLAARLCESAKRSNSLEEFFEGCANKSYTNARIRRVVLYAFFGVEKARLAAPPAFTRLLAANEAGRRFLQQVDFPILTRKGDHRLYDGVVQEQVAFADRADSIYALADENPPVNKPFIQ